LFFSGVGCPFATTLFMIMVIIRMEVLSEKRMELLQTIASLISSIRTEKGCRRCDFCQSLENENDLCLLQEWDTQESLKCYLNSRCFRVLRGAMNLLKEPYEMTFQTAIPPVEMEGFHRGSGDRAPEQARRGDQGRKIDACPAKVPLSKDKIRL
jgi:quinol monooxygenase YgiN